MPVALGSFCGDIELKARPIEAYGLPDGFDIRLFQGKKNTQPTQDDVVPITTHDRGYFKLC